MGAIIIDRQATPYDQTSKIYALPALTDDMSTAVSGVFGVTEGNQHTTQLDKARYRVSYTLMPPTKGSLDPFRLCLMSAGLPAMPTWRIRRGRRRDFSSAMTFERLRGRNASGFTLVEVLVAAAVMALLFVVLSQVIAMTRQAISLNTGKLDASGQARAVFDRLAKDLSAKPMHPNLDMADNQVCRQR